MSPAMLDTRLKIPNPFALPAPVAVIATCAAETRTPFPFVAVPTHPLAAIGARGIETDSTHEAGAAPPCAVRLGTVPLVCEPNNPSHHAVGCALAVWGMTVSIAAKPESVNV